MRNKEGGHIAPSRPGFFWRQAPSGTTQQGMGCPFFLKQWGVRIQETFLHSICKPRRSDETIDDIIRAVALVSKSDHDTGRDVESKRAFKASSNMIGCSLGGDSNS